MKLFPELAVNIGTAIVVLLLIATLVTAQSYASRQFGITLLDQRGVTWTKISSE